MVLIWLTDNGLVIRGSGINKCGSRIGGIDVLNVRRRCEEGSGAKARWDPIWGCAHSCITDCITDFWGMILRIVRSGLWETGSGSGGVLDVWRLSKTVLIRHGKLKCNNSLPSFKNVYELLKLYCVIVTFKRSNKSEIYISLSRHDNLFYEQYKIYNYKILIKLKILFS